MSMHEAREFVRNNRNTCLILCRTLACNSSFENAPKPFCELGTLYDHEFTSSMFVIILWFMSWTSVYTCEKAKEFIKHVNNLRQSDKILKSTRDQTYDDSVTIDLAHLKLSFDTMTLSCQSGCEESDDDLSPVDELLMTLESENRSELFSIMRTWNFHSTAELTSMEAFIRRLETIPIMQLPIQHRADFRRICELAYTEYYNMFVALMVRSMDAYDLKPQSGKEDNGGVKTTNDSDETSTEGDGKLMFGLTVQECTTLMCVATACTAAILKMTDVLEERKLKHHFRPQSGMEAMRESLDQPENLDNEGSKSIKTEPEQQGKQLLMKLKPQSGMETMRESLDQPEKPDNEGSKSLKTEPEQQGKQAVFRLSASQPARQLSNVDNVAGLNLQAQAVTATSGMFRCTHNNIK